MVLILFPGRLLHVARRAFVHVRRHVLLLEHQLWVQSRQAESHLFIRATVQHPFQEKVGRDPQAIGERHDEEHAWRAIALLNLVQGRGIHAQ